MALAPVSVLFDALNCAELEPCLLPFLGSTTPFPAIPLHPPSVASLPPTRYKDLKVAQIWAKKFLLRR